ncbi:MepB protein [Leptospira barantonii]|uniref:MepB protein n=1 Tax=Leptospira barantonii TaxID=2023184 RepID=A0A5F2B6X5_9LEPT|nr:MepB family protein [Leptospira barantonii]TGM01097.1 MepB protein [Leptospira barantonii]
MQKKISTLKELPAILSEVNLLFSKNCNLEIENYRIEKESEDYNAASFTLNDKQVVFRLAKITPKKIGMFVTLWKRNKNGITAPYHKKDRVDLIIIEVRKLNRVAHFVFNKEILIEKGIFTSNKEGKRGFRIYPTWESPSSKQAHASQVWQSRYFFENHKIDSDTLRLWELLNLKS